MRDESEQSKGEIGCFFGFMRGHLKGRKGAEDDAGDLWREGGIALTDKARGAARKGGQ